MEDAEKPPCQLSGTNGNVFMVIANVTKALKAARQPERAMEFKKKVMSGDYTYDQIIGKLVYEYVEVH